MYIILQSFPEEKILFASSSEKEAFNYFNLQVQHGQGWYELWDENSDIPMKADGDSFYAPYSPDKWDNLKNTAANTAVEKKSGGHIFQAADRHRLILTTWE